MKGRIRMSILRTIRLSMALSFKSGTYVAPVARSCSILPWSAYLLSAVVIVGGSVQEIESCSNFGPQRDGKSTVACTQHSRVSNRRFLNSAIHCRQSYIRVWLRETVVLVGDNKDTTLNNQFEVTSCRSFLTLLSTLSVGSRPIGAHGEMHHPAYDRPGRHRYKAKPNPLCRRAETQDTSRRAPPA